MEDKFKDLFNNPSLENEDWLEPGPELLGTITDEIYPAEKKRKKYFFMLFFSGLFLALLLFLFVNPSNTDKKTHTSEIISEINPSNTTDLNTTDLNNTDSKFSVIVAKDDVENLEIERQNNTVENESQPSFKNPNNTPKKKSTFRTNKKKEEVPSAKLRNTQTDQSRFIPASKDYASANIDTVIKNNTSNNITSTDNKNAIPSTTILGNLASKPLAVINLFPFLKSKDLQPFDHKRSMREINSDKRSDLFIDIPADKGENWFLEIGAGVSIANFVLNDNYSSDLDPFDFTHEDAQGYYVSISGSKPLSEKLNLKLVSSFENLTMNSGHNSGVIYNLDEEDGASNNIRALGMATPLGFISSEIVIERVAMVADNETNLTVDLQNKHTIQLIELGGVGEYSLIGNDRINLKSSVGFGASYLLNIKNDLKSFTPSNANFVSSNSKITSDQSNINSLTPFLDLGLSICYYIRRGISLGGSYRYKKNLQAVYQQDDYNSTMNRQNFGLFVRCEF